MAQTRKTINPDPPQQSPALLDVSQRPLSTDDVARLLVVPVTTLYCWRYKGMGPRAYRVGKYLRYRLEDVMTWLEGCADDRRS